MGNTVPPSQEDFDQLAVTQTEGFKVSANNSPLVRRCEKCFELGSLLGFFLVSSSDTDEPLS